MVPTSLRRDGSARPAVRAPVSGCCHLPPSPLLLRVSVSSGCCDKIPHRPGGLSNRNVSPQISGGSKVQDQGLARSASGEVRTGLLSHGVLMWQTERDVHSFWCP